MAPMVNGALLCVIRSGSKINIDRNNIHHYVGKQSHLTHSLE